MNYIEWYNKTIRDQLQAAMKYHGLSMDLIEPKTMKGVKKQLGVWDFDGHYKVFKTIGAKRYIVWYSDDERNKDKKNKISMTVAGLNKKVCLPYLIKKFGRYGLWGNFKKGLYVPGKYTGKLTHTYIDTEREGVIYDYLGNPGTYHELSFVHLCPGDYSLSIPREYTDYIADIKTEYNM